MKNLGRFWLVLVGVLTVAGCASNWALENEPVGFIPEVLKAIDSANSRPIKLTDAQRDQLFPSLHGSVRHSFFNDDLLPEVWASRGVFPGPNGEHDTVIFARFPKKKGGYFAYVGYFSTGQLFESGGGRDDGTLEPPWVR